MFYLLVILTTAIADDVYLSTLTANAGFRLLGTAENHFTGKSVNEAGDVNGDGISDFIVSARGPASSNGWYVQTVYVIFGRSQATQEVTPFGNILLPLGVPLNAAIGFRVLGSMLGDLSDRTASAAGDVNNDGVGDLIFGAPPTGSGGVVYVLFGRNQTFLSTNPFGDVDLAAMVPSPSIGFRILGGAAGDQCGASVRAAGDVNGDGIDDIILSAPYAGYPHSSSGRSEEHTSELQSQPWIHTI